MSDAGTPEGLGPRHPAGCPCPLPRRPGQPHAWAIRLFALLVAAYALSPIDLIPDAIPVPGLLDEAFLLPLAMLLLLLRALPPALLAEFRAAATAAAARPVSRLGVALVVLAWLSLGALLPGLFA
ncbi:YkvA family protein [Roseococcus sp. SDR]|uniref:YkvA family protein n=1 Tax=Roseococcus sp. SDR TaxID=2835532 RepID=UPI0020C02B01|nr:DUF1232 domain-containing protein [Roseococcus sp. SDR]